MEIFCDVMLGNDPVGTGRITKEGLYYHFFCSCRFTGQVVFSIFAACGDNHIDLGICVPKDNRFILDKRIPAKRLGEGEITLFAQPRHPELTGKFVPILAEEPFAYLERLQKCCLKKRGKTLGVVLDDV